MGEQIGPGALTVESLIEQIAALKAEHQALKRRLTDFEAHRYLSPTEQLERRRLQKLKLRAKDQIVRLRHALPAEA
jgi:uncharacterized protein YdcH (DUF465 family)